MQSSDKQEPLIVDYRWFRQGCTPLLQSTQSPRQVFFEIADQSGLTDIKRKPGSCLIARTVNAAAISEPAANLPIAIYLEVIIIELRDPAIFAYVIDNPSPGIEF